MSIFGINKNYLVYGTTTIGLNHSTVSADWFQNQDVRYRSIITGVKTHSLKGDYADFTITERCWQETNPNIKLDAIMQCEGKNVTFFYNGAIAFTDCYVNYVKPFYFKNLRNYDACVIFLQPINYVIISRRLKFLDGKKVRFLNGKFAKTRGIIL